MAANVTPARSKFAMITSIFWSVQSDFLNIRAFL
jgi:hypothetical protein